MLAGLAGSSALASVGRRLLCERLASHAGASCSSSGGGGGAAALRAHAAAAAASEGGPRPAAGAEGGSTADDDGAAAATVELPVLTPEQRKQLPMLLGLVQKPVNTARRVGTLTALAATYRDLAVVMSTLNLRYQGVLHPLVATDAEYADAVSRSASVVRGSYLPLDDVSKISDGRLLGNQAGTAPSELQLDQKYMDKVSCWMQLLPSHVEMSYPLLTGIKLFPPAEATYPTFVDFDAALRLLDHRKSRKRMKLARKMLKRQDKFQLAAWDHHPGEA